MKSTIAILAAGKGSRMHSDLPKTLVPLQGKALLLRLMETIVSSDYKNEKIYLIVSPDNKGLIAAAVKDFNVELVLQNRPLGTGHAVQSLSKYFVKNNIEVKNLLVLYGDHPLLSAHTINRLLAVDLSLDEPIYLLTTQRLCGFADLFMHWGRIIRDERGKILAIREYKDASLDEKNILEVNPALMVFNYKWLENSLSALKNNNKAGEYYLTDLIKIAVDNNLPILSGGVLPQETVGVNTPEELVLAENLLNGEALACPF